MRKSSTEQKRGTVNEEEERSSDKSRNELNGEEERKISRYFGCGSASIRVGRIPRSGHRCMTLLRNSATPMFTLCSV